MYGDAKGNWDEAVGQGCETTDVCFESENERDNPERISEVVVHPICGPIGRKVSGEYVCLSKEQWEKVEVLTERYIGEEKMRQLYGHDWI